MDRSLLRASNKYKKAQSSEFSGLGVGLRVQGYKPFRVFRMRGPLGLEDVKAGVPAASSSGLQRACYATSFSIQELSGSGVLGIGPRPRFNASLGRILFRATLTLNPERRL